MATELKIPHLGESITEVQIAEWLKTDGDEVKKDENVAVIDSEKTTLELPAPETGRLKILRPAGGTVKVGETIGQIETNGAPEKSKIAEGKTKGEEKPEAKPETKRLEKKEAPEKAPLAKKEKSSGPGQKQPEQKSETGEEKPEVREAKTEKEKAEPKEEAKGQEQLASDLETKIEKPSNGAGQAPRLSQTGGTEGEKLETSATPVLREEEIVPMTLLRRTAAKRLVEAKQQMAMLTTFNEVDMSAVQVLRKENGEAFEKRYQVKLGFMPFFVKAAIDALKQFPQLNAEIRGNDVVYHGYFDIGVAIASERGLVVPVLRGAERLSFAGIEKAIGDFAQRARDGKLKPDELEGGTFTITNGGVFGSLLSTPIINPPQTGILGMHAIQERPAALQGQVVIRPMMFLALTYDHRIVDGREAVLFLRRVKEGVENPARMLIEI